MILRLASVLALVVWPASAQTGFEGAWGVGDADRCVSGGTSLCPILEIRDGVLHSALAACTMTDPVPLPEIGAVMLTLTCDAAPVTWDQRALFQIDDTGRLTIVRRTGTRQYLPLSPEAPPPLFPLR